MSTPQAILSRLFGVPCGRIILIYESSDRPYEGGFSLGAITATLQFTALTTNPLPMQAGSIVITEQTLRQDALPSAFLPVSYGVEACMMECRAVLLYGPETRELLGSLA